MPPKKTATPNPDAARLARERDALATDKSRYRKQWRTEERKRRGLQRELEAKDAEIALRAELYQLGVQDVDYGLRLLTRELEGKSETDIGAFDRAAFFTGLRTSKPYLFGEKVAPATTGTSGGTARPEGAGAAGGTPPPPGAGDAAARDAKGSQFDARSAKPGDVSKRLQELGLNPLH